MFLVSASKDKPYESFLSEYLRNFFATDIADRRDYRLKSRFTESVMNYGLVAVSEKRLSSQV